MGLTLKNRSFVLKRAELSATIPDPYWSAKYNPTGDAGLFWSPRFTIRRMMVAVSIIALLVSLSIFGARQRSFVIMAEDYAKMETQARLMEKEASDPFLVGSLIVIQNELVQIKKQNVAYYAQLKEKYERAARFPWLSVEADPPEPPDPEWIPDSEQPLQADPNAPRSSYGLIVMPPRSENGAP